MADEIGISLALSATPPNGATLDVSFSTTQDMTGNDVYQATQTFTTSEAAVAIGPCAQIEYIAIKNLATSGNLIVGLSNPITQPLTIKPGKMALLPGIGTLYGKSSTGTVQAMIGVTET